MSPSGMKGIYVEVDEEPNKGKSRGYIANEDLIHGLQDMESDSDADDDDDDDDFDPTPVVTPKQLDDMFTIEQRDPKHRRGDYLFLLKGEYDRDPASRGGDEAAFFKWIDRLTTTKFRDAMLAALTRIGADAKFRKKTAAEIFTDLTTFLAGVKYKGRQTKDGLLIGARKYQIRFDSGRVKRFGEVQDVGGGKKKWVDTGKLNNYSTFAYTSHWSGDGWGIWVQGLDGTFYSNRMRVGRFQHSSFLNGTSVGAAGEWQVNDGIIKKISGRSGHYKPQFEQFMHALRELSWQSLASFNNTEVMLFDRMSYSKDVITVPAGELLKDPDAYRNYKLDPLAL